jgi:two-component system sensor histidine kinase KdpD
VEDALIFVMYFIIASVSGLLISRIRTQQILINQREKKTAALYGLTRDLSSSKSLDDVTECAIRHLKGTFDSEVALIYCDAENKLNKKAHSASTFIIDGAEWNVAFWVFINSQRAGRFTGKLLITAATYFPLTSKSGNLGVIGLILPENSSFSEETESLLNTFLLQISIAVEREYLKELNKTRLVLAESEKLYKTLFDSISHEVKTPITTIIGAASSFKDEAIASNRDLLSKLINEINIAAERLNRLVDNLLDITRLESGNLKLKVEWHSVVDLINSVLNRMKNEYPDHKIIYIANEDALILQFDFPLLEQALTNIIHNSIEYTPPESIINISANKSAEFVIITIADNGGGFPEDSMQNLFKKFYRIPGTKAGGIGLGLSIARGFIEAHNGTVSASNRKSGGAEFVIKLPIN